MEGICKTILDLTRSKLVDSTREEELTEILTARDPVRLVTTRSLFPRPPLALVAFEVPRLKEKLWTGGRWLDPRSLSRCLDLFLHGQQDDCIPGLLSALGLDGSSSIRASPDGGLLLVGADSSAEVMARLVQGFRRTTGGLDLQVAAEPIWPDEALLGRSPDLVRPPRFGALLDSLRQQLSRSRQRVPGDSFPTLPGFLQRCQACDQALASERDEELGQLICPGCQTRRATGRAQSEPGGELPDEAIDMSDAGGHGRSDRTDHVAVIVASLSGVDPLVVELGGLDQVSLTHGAMDRVLVGATQALVERLGLRRRYQLHRTGVGQMTVVLPAGRSLDAVRRLVEGVEALLTQEAEALGGYPEIQEGLRQMRLRVGMVILRPHHPPRVAVGLAESLAGSARRLAMSAVGGPDPVSTIDFWVIHDGAPVSTCVDELRHQIHESRRDFRLTLRPYRYPDFRREILDCFRVFRRIPRSQVHELRQVLLADLRAADLNLRYRVASSEDWRSYATEFAGKDPSRWENLLFRTAGDGVRETSFFDLIELTEFLD
ncbi:MAG: hypothetical protein HY815_19885 [Candidatus Riflebacteria bacterium]|nr:hypothetical protein [Candidatus Riflebacteria bacterium]